MVKKKHIFDKKKNDLIHPVELKEEEHAVKPINSVTPCTNDQ